MWHQTGQYFPNHMLLIRRRAQYSDYISPNVMTAKNQRGSYRCVRKVKVKWSCYRPGVAQRVGTGIALPFHDRGTRRGWVVSSTAQPHFTPGKDLVHILQEAGWVPGPVWTGGESRPHQDSIHDRPARSQSLYRLGYPVIPLCYVYKKTNKYPSYVFIYY